MDFSNDLEDESLSSYVKSHPDVFVRYCTYKNTDGTDCLSVYYRFDKESQSVTRYDVCTIDPSEKWTVSDCGGFERIKYLDGPIAIEPKYNCYVWKESTVY